MKIGIALGLALCLSTSAFSQSGDSSTWLRLLNAESGRSQKLVAEQVLFGPATSDQFPGLVSVGYRQSDGTFTLGSLIWEGKVWSPMAGYAHILNRLGYAEADDAARNEMFLSLLKQSNEPLGIHPYTGTASREEDRPRPPSSSRQIDGQQRVELWFWKEPGDREGVEWRRVLYLVNLAEGRVKVRTLGTFYPEAEKLRGFPSSPSGSSE